jgi:hypothetical protein
VAPHDWLVVRGASCAAAAEPVEAEDPLDGKLAEAEASPDEELPLVERSSLVAESTLDELSSSAAAVSAWTTGDVLAGCWPQAKTAAVDAAVTTAAVPNTMRRSRWILARRCRAASVMTGMLPARPGSSLSAG